MSFAPGERLAGGERCVYEVLGQHWATPRFEFFRARKRFWNFRYPAHGLDEAPLEEGLNVLVRCSRVARDLETFRFERERVLGGSWSPWLLEPVDVVEREPEGSLLILADPGVGAAQGGPAAGGGSFERVEGMLHESLSMLAAFREQGLIATEFGPADFVFDAAGRWFFLATDRVIERERLEAEDADIRALEECAAAWLGPFDDGSDRAGKSLEAIHARFEEARDAVRGARSEGAPSHWIRRLIGNRRRSSGG